MQKAMSFNNVAIVYVTGIAYRIHFWYMRCKSGVWYKRGVLYFFLLYIKMSECNSIECNSVELTYYQRNWDMILNRAKDYYENDKKGLREQARDKYRNLSEEEKK